MLHIYYGDGKGKTTAAIGAAVRAAGQGLHVLLVQFLKGENTGERHTLAQIENITLMPCPLEIDFTFDMTEAQKAQTSKIVKELFERSVKISLTEKYDVLIFDEVFSALQAKMLVQSELIAFLAEAPNSLEIVLTGHNPPDAVLAMGDYISRIRKIRHPYDKGIAARKGIEF
ncbi:MAG: cob(I)yrinic acid a,c-diamide adenosyltransferase [Oscillospiraceae bacterium]|jgi:cob(I)alamin adenosyltransferase|nr:cob(I)yrinic acid a,c-diamide adenosyltransferase [Oscillospiraceae bacterium]